MNKAVQSQPTSTPYCIDNKAITSATSISYEKPLNERLRVFLQLEQLFRHLNEIIDIKTTLDKRAAVDCLLDIMFILKLYNLKLEIIKEIENQVALSRKNHNSDEITTLYYIGQQLSDITIKPYCIKRKNNDNIMDGDLLKSIALRRFTPGGAQSFLLPQYHYWLAQDNASCQSDLKEWNDSFKLMRQAIQHILNLIRNRITMKDHVALAGFFQTNFDSQKNPQIIKVTVDIALPCFAEISASKHRCNIRFMTLSKINQPPMQSKNNIPFTLIC